MLDRPDHSSGDPDPRRPALSAPEAEDLTPREAEFLREALSTIDAITTSAGEEVRRITTRFLIIGVVGVLMAVGALAWLAVQSSQDSEPPAPPAQAVLDMPLAEGTFAAALHRLPLDPAGDIFRVDGYPEAMDSLVALPAETRCGEGDRVTLCAPVTVETARDGWFLAQPVDLPEVSKGGTEPSR